MHTKVFNTKEHERVVVQFNSDFSGLADITWGDGINARGSGCVRVPAIALTVGIAALADSLSELAEHAQELNDQAAPDGIMLDGPRVSVQQTAGTVERGAVVTGAKIDFL